MESCCIKMVEMAYLEPFKVDKGLVPTRVLAVSLEEYAVAFFFGILFFSSPLTLFFVVNFNKIINPTS